MWARRGTLRSAAETWISVFIQDEHPCAWTTGLPARCTTVVGARHAGLLNVIAPRLVCFTAGVVLAHVLDNTTLGQTGDFDATRAL